MNIVFKNYKPFQGKHSIRIKPFNVFIGRNNAGKSSLSEIIYYATNIRFLSGTGSNIFRINDISRKDGLINNHVNINRFDTNEIDSLVTAIIKIEISIANDRWKLKQLPKSSKKAIIKMNENLNDSKKRLDQYYKKLFSVESTPMWVLESRMYAFTRMEIEKHGSHHIKNQKDNAKYHNFIIAHIKKSIVYRAAEYLSPRPHNGLGLELYMHFNPYGLNRTVRFSMVSDMRTFRDISDPKLPLAKDIYNQYGHIDEKFVPDKVTALETSLEERIANRPSFEESKYYKLFTKDSNNFVEVINEYILHTFLGANKLVSVPDIKFGSDSRGRLEIRDDEVPIPIEHDIKCTLNVTDNDLDIIYSASESEIVNKAHISYSKSKGHIYGKVPAKFSYLYDSSMYNNNIDFVSKLLEKAAKNFINPELSPSAVPIKKLEGVLHINNCYYYDIRENIPGSSTFSSGVFPKPNFGAPRMLIDDPHKLSTFFQQTIDNLPIKVDKALSSSNLKKQKKVFLQLTDNNIVDRKHKLILTKDGKQKEGFDYDLNTTYHQDVSGLFGFQNDIDAIAAYMRHPKFKDVVFPHFRLDIETNKVLGNSTRLENLYAEFVNDDRENIHPPTRGIKGLYQYLLSKSMEIHELNSLYVKHLRKTKKVRTNMTNKDRKTLERIERFLIGGYLSSASAKVLELINAHIFYKNFSNNLASERAIKGFDTYGRPNDAIMKASIIDPIVFSKKKKQVYDIGELEALFGKDIHAIIGKPASVKRLNTAVNNHLKNLDIKYIFDFGFLGYNRMGELLSPGVEDPIVPEAFYLQLHEVDPESGKRIGVPIDFNNVGQGTRNLIAIFVQLELSRRRKGFRNNLVIIREPENFLHPNLIGRFIRYLIKLTSGSRVDIILETHSEIILRQLQVLVKNSKSSIEDSDIDSIQKEDLAIYYIDKNDEKGSEIEEILMDEQGFFEKDLPDNFFAQNSKLIQGMWD